MESHVQTLDIGSFQTTVTNSQSNQEMLNVVIVTIATFAFATKNTAMVATGIMNLVYGQFMHLEHRPSE